MLPVIRPGWPILSTATTATITNRRGHLARGCRRALSRRCGRQRPGGGSRVVFSGDIITLSSWFGRYPFFADEDPVAACARGGACWRNARTRRRAVSGPFLIPRRKSQAGAKVFSYEFLADKCGVASASSSAVCAGGRRRQRADRPKPSRDWAPMGRSVSTQWRWPEV